MSPDSAFAQVCNWQVILEKTANESLYLIDCKM